MSENETMADIRREAEGMFRELCIKHVDDLGHMQAMQQFNRIFDRIEAATKREREKLSSCYVRSTNEAARIIGRSGAVNAAKMYKALVTIREKCVIYNNALAEEIDAICGNAISAPPRNCDVYDNPYDAADAWPENELCAGRRFNNKSCDGCGYSPARCVSRWLYEAAKGEVGK